MSRTCFFVRTLDRIDPVIRMKGCEILGINQAGCISYTDGWPALMRNRLTVFFQAQESATPLWQLPEMIEELLRRDEADQAGIFAFPAFRGEEQDRGRADQAETL